MAKKDKIIVQGTEIILLSHQKEDYISLTDMAKYKNAEIPATVISHWLSTNFSINYMGLWERMNNPNFNLTGFREVKMLSTETGFGTTCSFVEYGKYKRLTHSAGTAATRTACTTE
ncbi:MAG: KilA-N domain-containing protein [Paludibacter sp.]|nr:KilA-N domain-containing protein [Paludibacter sp.]